MLTPGQSFGNYRIIDKIGMGGMGAVYLAEHPLIGKQVALKVIHNDLSANKEVITRFFNEARAANQIGNEHIVSIHDFGQTDDGQHFYIMEYIEGRTLAQALGDTQVMRPERVLHIAAQLAAGLSAAHAVGIIHRDLKPDNIMVVNRLGDADFTKILDFGLAKVLDSQKQLTAIGVVLGTPQYMSPEACESRRDIDHRCDIYSVGILMFQMLCGQVPFLGDSMGEVLVKQVTQLPPAPRALNPSIPPSVEQIVLRCLAKDRVDRFQTMAELRTAVLAPEQYLASSPPVVRSSGGKHSMTMTLEAQRRSTVPFAGVSVLDVQTNAALPREDRQALETLVGKAKKTGVFEAGPPRLQTSPPAQVEHSETRPVENVSEHQQSQRGQGYDQQSIHQAPLPSIPAHQARTQYAMQDAAKGPAPIPAHMAKTAYHAVVGQAPMGPTVKAPERQASPQSRQGHAGPNARTAFMDPSAALANAANAPNASGPSGGATQYMPGDALISEPPQLPEHSQPPGHNRTIAIAPPPGYKEHPPPPPTSNGLTIAVVAMAGLGALAVLGFAWPGFFLASKSENQGQQAIDAGSLVATTTDDAMPIDAALPIDAAPIDGATPMALISLESKPSGATVTDADGKVVGKTPVTVTLERSETPAVFSLSHPRTKNRKTSVVPSGDKRLVVELVVNRRGGPRGPKRETDKNPDRTLKPF